MMVVGSVLFITYYHLPKSTLFLVSTVCVDNVVYVLWNWSLSRYVGLMTNIMALLRSTLHLWGFYLLAQSGEWDMISFCLYVGNVIVDHNAKSGGFFALLLSIGMHWGWILAAIDPNAIAVPFLRHRRAHCVSWVNVIYERVNQLFGNLKGDFIFLTRSNMSSTWANLELSVQGSLIGLCNIWLVRTCNMQSSYM